MEDGSRVGLVYLGKQCPSLRFAILIGRSCIPQRDGKVGAAVGLLDSCYQGNIVRTVDRMHSHPEYSESKRGCNDQMFES